MWAEVWLVSEMQMQMLQMRQGRVTKGRLRTCALMSDNVRRGTNRDSNRRMRRMAAAIFLSSRVRNGQGCSLAPRGLRSPC